MPSLPSSPTSTESVDGGEGAKLSLIEMLEELENSDYSTLKRQQLSKHDISGPTATSGPTFVENGGETTAASRPPRLTPELMRKRVSSSYDSHVIVVLLNVVVM